MKELLQDFLIIDIETVSAQKSLDKLQDSLQTHWERKTEFIRNPDDKDPAHLFSERAGIYAEFGKIVTIGMGFYYERNGKMALRVKSLASHDEDQLLREFKDFIESKFDQDHLRLCAHNGKEFDFPYLCRRMLINDISIPWSLNLKGKKPWEVNHIDTMELWRFGDWKNFTSLDLLTSLFNIPSSKSEMDGSMVTKTYYEDPEGLKKIKEYCKRDVVATAQLYLRLNSLPIIESNHITLVE